jgi:hypothetical protein
MEGGRPHRRGRLRRLRLVLQAFVGMEVVLGSKIAKAPLGHEEVLDFASVARWSLEIQKSVPAPIVLVVSYP